MTELETYDVTEEKLSSVKSSNTSLSHSFSIVVRICIHMEAHVQIKRGPVRDAQLGMGPSLPPLLPSHTTGYSRRELSL